jgi:Flp pilus assembly protein TadD
MDEFKSLLERAKKCIEEGRFGEAEAYLRSATALDISSPQPHNLYGVLLERSGDRLRALRHYRAATDLDPTYMPAKNNLFRAGSFNPQPERADFG